MRARPATVQDAAGRALPIPIGSTRVFPAGPPAAILLYTLAPDLLLGWPRANRPEECAFMLPDICARPEVGRITGRGNTANLESVLALKPDLILDVGSTDADLRLARRRACRSRPAFPTRCSTAASTRSPRPIALLGELTGATRRRSRWRAMPRTRSRRSQARIDRIPEGERPRVYYARGPRGLETGLGGSINVETIEFLGARNVAGERKGGLATVSVEQVLLWNPDVIVTIDRDFAANVRSDPVWAAVTAVRAGRVHLSPKMPFGWVDFPPSVNRLIGLWWLAKILYPEQFPGGHPRADARFLHALLSRDADATRRSTRVLAGRG